MGWDSRLPGSTESRRHFGSDSSWHSAALLCSLLAGSALKIPFPRPSEKPHIRSRAKETSPEDLSVPRCPRTSQATCRSLRLPIEICRLWGGLPAELRRPRMLQKGLQRTEFRSSSFSCEQFYPEKLISGVEYLLTLAKTPDVSNPATLVTAHWGTRSDYVCDRARPAPVAIGCQVLDREGPVGLVSEAACLFADTCPSPRQSRAGESMDCARRPVVGECEGRNESYSPEAKDGGEWALGV